MVLGFVWVIAAAAISALPRRWVRPGALGLILTGIPLLGLITYAHGPIAGLIALGIAASVLRWPLVLPRPQAVAPGRRGQGVSRPDQGPRLPEVRGTPHPAPPPGRSDLAARRRAGGLALPARRPRRPLPTSCAALDPRRAGVPDGRRLEPHRARRRPAGRGHPPRPRLQRDRGRGQGRVTAGAAALDAHVARRAAEAGVDLTFLRTIPGAIGGAVRMNAGCYGVLCRRPSASRSARVTRDGRGRRR